MSTATIESKKFPQGFPDRTRLRIEWVADEFKRRDRAWKSPRTFYRQRRLFWKGEVAGSFTKNFDPGKYEWKAHKEVPGARDNFSEKGVMLVDMTQEQWKKISHMEPRMQHAMMVTDGIVFHCKFPGCDKRTTSKVSALLHESDEHYGVDLLTEPDRKEEVDAQMDQVVQKRGPGRPRKEP